MKRTIECYMPHNCGREITTGNWLFAEGKFLCRAPNIGHSTKSVSPESHPRWRETLCNMLYAESPTLSKERLSAKLDLCQESALGKVYDSRRSITPRNAVLAISLAESYTFGSRKRILLRWVPASWLSAKGMFAKHLLASLGDSLFISTSKNFQ